MKKLICLLVTVVIMTFAFAGVSVNARSTDGDFEYYYFSYANLVDRTLDNNDRTDFVVNHIAFPSPTATSRLYPVNAKWYNDTPGGNAAVGAIGADGLVNYDNNSGNYYMAGAKLKSAGESRTIDVYVNTPGTYTIWALVPHNNAPSQSNQGNTDPASSSFAKFSGTWSVAVNGGVAQTFGDEEYDYSDPNNSPTVTRYSDTTYKEWKNSFYWDKVTAEFVAGKNELTFTATTRTTYISAMLVTNDNARPSTKFAYIGTYDSWSTAGGGGNIYLSQNIKYFGDGQYHADWQADGFINLREYSDLDAPTLEIDGVGAVVTDNAITFSWTAIDPKREYVGKYTATWNGVVSSSISTMGYASTNGEVSTFYADASGIYETRIYENDQLIATISDGSTSYTYDAPFTGSVYNFKVEVIDRFGNVTTDTAILTTTGPAETEAPHWPDGSGILVENATLSSTITWPGAVDNREIIGYEIYENSVAPENLVELVTNATTSYTFDLNPGETKDIIVVAKDRVGLYSEPLYASIQSLAGTENYLIRAENIADGNNWSTNSVASAMTNAGMYISNTVAGQSMRGVVAYSKISNKEASGSAAIYIDTPGEYTAFVMAQNSGTATTLTINNEPSTTAFGGTAESITVSGSSEPTWSWQKADRTWIIPEAGWYTVTVSGKLGARVASIFLTDGIGTKASELTYVNDNASKVVDGKINVALYEDPVAPTFAEGDFNAVYDAASKTVVLTWPAAMDAATKPTNAASSSTYMMMSSGLKKYNIYVNNTLVGTTDNATTTFTITAENLGREIVPGETLIIDVDAVDAFANTVKKRTINMPGVDVYEYGNYKFVIENNKVTIVGIVKEPSGEITIPDEIDGFSVTGIGAYAFCGCSSITKVTIPEGITTIGNNAFDGCTGLARIVIPKSVTSIGAGAFNGCTRLSGGVYITDLAAWCGIEFGNEYANPLYYAYRLYLNDELVTDLVIPEGVTEIDARAFANCYNITSVRIPSSLKTVGVDAFIGCSNLTGVYITDLAAWCGIEFEPKVVNNRFNCYANPLYVAKNLYLNNELVTELEFPEGVTEIGGYAFIECTSITSVRIPTSLKTVGEHAFVGCDNLTGVYITDLAAWCGIEFDCYLNNNQYSFYANPLYCAKNLYLNNELVTDLEFPEGVTEIGGYAFVGCESITSVRIPTSLKTVGEYAFYRCSNLTGVYITDLAAWCGIKFMKSSQANPLSYAKNLYLNNELVTDLVIPEGVTKINFVAFNLCESITSVTIPGTVKSIYTGAFYHCENLKTATILDGVTTLGGSMFDGCSSLENVIIPDSVTTIGAAAFRDCSSLKSITIPGTMENILQLAFKGCTGLETVYYNGKEEKFAEITVGEENELFVNAEKVYFAYVTILDASGREISKQKTSWNGTVDVSGFDGDVKLYTDKALTQEFALSTPITENLTLYIEMDAKTITTISDDGKTITVSGVNLDKGCRVIVALYKGGQFVEIQSAIYESENLIFTTTTEYDTVKVMAWGSFGNLIPITNPEIH